MLRLLYTARSSKADMHAVRIEKGAAAKAKLEAQIKTLQEEARAQRPESDGAGRRQTSEKLEAVAGHPPHVCASLCLHC